ncbi:MAG: TetR family transcriptional regulator [Alphaproteobacteria bacterium]|nr:TetR family transcriptional regulator [Alphaproteobacteria bacterium]MBU1514946.1 TetR family transcriptional regulator [Alphaproteobacteria bacterium]MBU2095617.1 TetR family transcriptional regulator [Alphaproteobacteria bacterium]MBU2149697.1 TetR family transcriptional regulator [Alphaproteobacteria bacterium]MBU2309078.1 TetR family transcriptional regulator [Alphaproteobacteria bacterium]
MTTQEPASAARGRSPIQARSRDRVDRILAMATEIIAERGGDHLKMSDLAARTGISIGSLYQYFPDKAAVMRALTARVHAGSRQCIEDALAPVRSRAELIEAFNGLIDVYWSLFLAEPAMRDIWAGAQADKALVELELSESRRHGEMLAAAIRRARPDADPEAVAPTAFLIWQLGEATMRLAIALPRAEGDAIVAAYKRMSVQAILAAG